MKKIVYKYRTNKFKRFMNGLLFAVIAIIAITLCLNEIINPTLSQIALILPFGIAAISLMLGLISMFHTEEATKEKI